MKTCEIRWIDDEGNPTPDNNEAVALCYMKAHHIEMSGRFVEIPETRTWLVCQAHIEQFDRDLDAKAEDHWIFIPLPATD